MLFLVTGIGMSLSYCGQLGPACPLGNWRTQGQSCAGEAEVHLCFREVGGQHRPSGGDSQLGGCFRGDEPTPCQPGCWSLPWRLGWLGEGS